MNFCGVEKSSLVDFGDKLTCTVFTHGCNFKCPFCHNATLVILPNEVDSISEDEFFSYISKRKGVLDGVCVTGGEPLLSSGITEFIKKIKSLGLLVKLDTNGSFPDKLESLLDQKLVDYVAMDIKNCKEKYAITSGINANSEYIEKADRSIDIIMQKAPDYEFRTTVVRELHTIEDIVKIANRIKSAKKYFLQTYVDSGNTIKVGYSAYSASEMLEILENTRKVLPVTNLRGI